VVLLPHRIYHGLLPSITMKMTKMSTSWPTEAMTPRSTLYQLVASSAWVASSSGSHGCQPMGSLDTYTLQSSSRSTVLSPYVRRQGTAEPLRPHGAPPICVWVKRARYG
jgi:hypothetical protein